MRLNDFEKHFFEPTGKNDMRVLHNIIIEQAMIFNQKISPESAENVVRKKEFSSFSNDRSTSENENIDNSKSGNSDKENRTADITTQKAHNSTKKTASKTSSKNQQSNYATSLLLSRLAYVMSNLAMQYSLNKQQREDEEKEQKTQPKFASKNHQRSKSKLTVQTPLQY